MKTLKQKHQELLEYNLLKFCSIDELEKLNQQITEQEIKWLTQKRLELKEEQLDAENEKPIDTPLVSSIFGKIELIDKLLEELKK